jgi:hypothetical protein
MFGSWLWGLEKDLKPLILLGAAATCSSLWLCRNDIIFSTFPLQVIYSIIHLLCTWAILQRPTSQDLVAAASLRLAQVVKEFLPRHMGGGLVFELIVIKVFWGFLIFLDCVHHAMQRPGVFQDIVST